LKKKGINYTLEISDCVRAAIHHRRPHTDAARIPTTQRVPFLSASDGVVAASATNEVGFAGSGGFQLRVGLYGDVGFLWTR
jgi:hypothetical protein